VTKASAESREKESPSWGISAGKNQDLQNGGLPRSGRVDAVVRSEKEKGSRREEGFFAIGMTLLSPLEAPQLMPEKKRGREKKAVYLEKKKTRGHE